MAIRGTSRLVVAPQTEDPKALRPVTDYPDVLHTAAQAVVRTEPDGSRVNVLTDRPQTTDESPASPAVSSR